MLIRVYWIQLVFADSQVIPLRGISCRFYSRTCARTRIFLNIKGGVSAMRDERKTTSAKSISHFSAFLSRALFFRRLLDFKDTNAFLLLRLVGNLANKLHLFIYMAATSANSQRRQEKNESRQTEHLSAECIAQGVV